MRKFLALAMTAILGACCVGLVGCGNSGSNKSEIALITDVGNIDDKSFNEGTWNGVKEYGRENNINYKYYRPAENTNDARIEKIKDAIADGNKVIVCPGYLFEEAIYEVQDTYPDTRFILIDGEPHDANRNYKTSSNVHCILYKEEQAGYLAGYAAVMDGYRKLGFIGGMSVPAVIRYGFGFIQGIDAAAVALNTQCEVQHWYSASFAPTDAINAKANEWYSKGTEVIFACGGGLYTSVTKAAGEKNAKVIGVDVDQYNESETIITSAMKELATSTKLALKSLYDNNLNWSAEYAGKTANLGAAEKCVGIPTAKTSWRFKTYTVEEYTKLFNKMVAGEITVSNDIANNPTVVKTTVNYLGDAGNKS